jgi:exo-beta-1,3-glucanase (GH17 family)
MERFETSSFERTIMWNPIMRGLLGYGSTLIALYMFWFVAGRPLMVKEPEVDDNHRLYSVSYSPLEKDQSPFDFAKGLTISEKRIDSDMALLSRRFSCIRMYSATGMESVPAYAEKYGLKVFLGAWVSKNPVNTQKELQTVIELAKRHPSSVQAVIVGNEALLRREVTGPQLAAYIRQIRSALPDVPVTYADVWEFWLKHPEVEPAVDFMMIHILPYWEDDPVAIDDAIDHVRTIRDQVAATFPEKEIMIGETGWPSQGRMREAALPSIENQARFIRGFIDLAEDGHWRYNLIEAFDQPWKRISEGAVGGYWGLYDPDRIDKNILSGPVSNFPNWLRLFYFSAGMALLTLPISMRHSAMSVAQWLKFSTGLMVGAILIVMQGNQFAIVTRNGWENLWAGTVLIQAGIAYLMTLDAIASGYPLHYFSLDSTIHFLYNRVRFGTKGREPVHRSSVICLSITRLGVVICALIAVLGLLIDSRYRNFNNAGFIIPAIAFAWFSSRENRTASPDALERISAMILIAAAIGVFINETPLNLQADIWVGVCLVLAWPLWRRSSGSPLRHLSPYGILIFAAYAIFAVIRHHILDSKAIDATCLDHPAEALCLFRSMVSMMIYDKVFGWTSLIVTGLAIWLNVTWLMILAMIVSLGSMIFHNVDMGAIGFVLSGFVFLYAKTQPFKSNRP